MSGQLAAQVFAVLTGLVVLFQLALAAGAPWGAHAMGGAYPGVFPARMRAAAVVNAVALTLLALVVLSRAELVLPAWHAASHWLVWVVIAVMGAGGVMNLLSPSKGERLLWTPVAILLFLAALVVGLSP